MTSSEISDYLYYRKLPQVYRDMDRLQPNYPLKRYLTSLVEGGFTDIITSSNDFLSLVDPERCPEEFLPYLCYSFGLEYFEDIDALYQRRLLSNIGELIRRRGTYSGVRFLIRSLTGLECQLSYSRQTYEGVTGRWLIVELDTTDTAYDTSILRRRSSSYEYNPREARP